MDMKGMTGKVIKGLICVVIICVAGVVNTGCRGGGSKGDRMMEIERFDRASMAFPTMDGAGRDSIKARYGEVIDFMSMLVGTASADSVMEALGSSAAVRVFQPDIESRLTDLTDVERQLGGARDRATSDFEGLAFPRRVIGIVMPYEQSVVVVDTIVLVGLNHYLGADYEGYAGFDDYRRRLKEPGRMVYDVVEAVVRTRFPLVSEGRMTVGGRMAYEGAIARMVEELIGGSTAASALGYSDEQFARAEDDEQMIWRGLVGDGTLYSMDQALAERLVAPAPYSTIVGAQVPGRIGRFVGYRLVDSYLKNNSGSTVEGLLSSGAYADDDFVVRSGYVGR